MTIKKKAINGVKWTSFSTIMRAVIQLVQLSVVAHFLSAEVLGLYALLQLCLAFFQIFIGVGIGNAIVHQQSTSERHLSELFFINLAIAMLLAVIFFFAAPLLAWFFEQHKLTPLLKLMSVVFVIIALSRIHLAQLQKKLEFAVIAKIELLSSVISFIVVIFFITHGYGLNSLVYGYLLSVSLQTLLFWLLSDFRPRFCYPASWHELQQYLNFGVYQTASAVVNYFNSQFDLILVGKIFGTEVLGAYSLIRQFCFRPAMVINPVLTRVAFPVMAKLQQSDQLANVFCRLSQTLASINFPLYLALIILAKPIITLVFGEQWLYMLTVFQLMASWCLVRSVVNPIGSLLMAVGKVKLAFKWNFFLLILFPLCILFGSIWGLIGVAFTLFILQILLLPGQWWFLIKQSADISFDKFFTALFIPLSIGITSTFVTLLLMTFLVTFELWLQLIIGVTIGGVIYILLSYKFNLLFRYFVNNFIRV
ncbi:MAG: colanic acid exporter [Robiginitomaculum sp.]|nr:MAG: colanic acid exporter [Robiginitomaculum sp.]